MARVQFNGGILLAVPIVVVLALAPRLLGAVAEAVPIFPAGSPPEKLAVAADAIEAATGETGSGYRFEIVQTQTLFARPGGPKIDIPDPNDRRASLGLVDEYLVTTYVERGIVTRAGFWSEIREAGPEPELSFASGTRVFGALVRDGKSWRDDGDGWYESDRLPGIGLDPATAAKLPDLLRNATGPTAAGTGTDAGRAIERFSATGRTIDIPGVIAADGLAFTELREPVEISLDNAGRPAVLWIVARNTNTTTYDLIVETTIRFLYSEVGSLPLPEPGYAPPTPTPAPSFDWPDGFTPPPVRGLD
jgi:hypothetical protein